MKLRIKGKLMTAGIAAMGLLFAGAGAASASTTPVQSSPLSIGKIRTGSLSKLGRPTVTNKPGSKISALPPNQYPGSGSEWVVQNLNSGKCLEVYHSETTDYANVDQYTCNGSNTQGWIFYLITNYVMPINGANYPVYEIQNLNSGKCLEVYHSETGNGANVDQYTCNGTNTQLWGYFPNGGNVNLVNANSKKVLEVYHSSTVDYGNVDQYTYNATRTQFWY